MTHAAKMQDFFDSGFPGWHVQRKQASNQHSKRTPRIMSTKHVGDSSNQLYSPQSPECPNAAGVHTQG